MPIACCATATTRPDRQGRRHAGGAGPASRPGRREGRADQAGLARRVRVGRQPHPEHLDAAARRSATTPASRSSSPPSLGAVTGSSAALTRAPDTGAGSGSFVRGTPARRGAVSATARQRSAGGKRAWHPVALGGGRRRRPAGGGVIRTMDSPRAVLSRRAIRSTRRRRRAPRSASGGGCRPTGASWPSSPAMATTGRRGCGSGRSNQRRARVLPGTEGAFRPFWSPDGQSVAFFADGRLKRINPAGGPPQTLATVGYRPSGGTWSSNGLILYSDRMSPIYAVPASGAGDGEARDRRSTRRGARSRTTNRSSFPTAGTSCSSPRAPTASIAAPTSARWTNRPRCGCSTAAAPR